MVISEAGIWVTHPTGTPGTIPRLLAGTPPYPQPPELMPHGPKPTEGAEAQDGMVQVGGQAGTQQDISGDGDGSERG